jgi:hypothetical protein
MHALLMAIQTLKNAQGLKCNLQRSYSVEIASLA